MKREIRKFTESEILRDFPIAGELDGWFFRSKETSNNVWEVEGSDLWGRKVYCQGNSLNELIAQAKTMAVNVTERADAL